MLCDSTLAIALGNNLGATGVLIIFDRKQILSYFEKHTRMQGLLFFIVFVFFYLH